MLNDECPRGTGSVIRTYLVIAHCPPEEDLCRRWMGRGRTPPVEALVIPCSSLLPCMSLVTCHLLLPIKRGNFGGGEGAVVDANVVNEATKVRIDAIASCANINGLGILQSPRKS